MKKKASPSSLRIGWAEVDITPTETIFIAGQFHARVSEGVKDRVTATALALESDGGAAVFVSCDLVGTPDPLRDAVRALLDGSDIDPRYVILHATHTHTGPEVRLPDWVDGTTAHSSGVDIDTMTADQYAAFAAERIAGAVQKAWASRKPAKVAYGLGYAVVGRNRRWVDAHGNSTMYGNTDTPDFRHIEGFEDHSVNVLATYDLDGSLSGVVVNVPCPSQVEESFYQISADYWHDTRVELRRRLGDKLFVLPQCSAAGDQSPHPIYEAGALERMWRLAGRSQREVIAARIGDAVEGVLSLIKDTAQPASVRHSVETLDLPMRALTQKDVDEALAEARKFEADYEEEKRKLEENPALKKEPRWYVPVSRAHRRMLWFRNVAERFERQKTQPTRRAELHFVRLGDVVFATNPYELYLDYGIFIKCRSSAAQTFLVQLAGGGTYVPTPRSTASGGYGSIPASNPLGPPAGRLMTDRSVAAINALFDG